MAVKSSRSGQWKKQRLRVLRRDNYVCRYCNGVANEADHVIPKVKGGDDSLDNLVAACRICNNRKGKKNEAVFLVHASTPLSSREPLHTMTQTVHLVGPFEGQEQSTWA